MASYCVILPAAGASSRFGKTHLKKPFVNLKNQAVWLYSAQRFLERSEVKQVIVVISESDREFFEMKFSANIAVMDLTLVIGGNERMDSVRNALEQVSDECDYVAIHDAARPCLTDEAITDVFDAAEKTGAAILASPIYGTIKKVGADLKVDETVSRDGLWQAQTPQVFRKNVLLSAYDSFQGSATDDAQVVEAAGHPVAIVKGPPSNLKITTKDDLKIAESILKATAKKPLLSEFAVPPSRKGGTLDDLLG